MVGIGREPTGFAPAFSSEVSHLGIFREPDGDVADRNWEFASLETEKAEDQPFPDKKVFECSFAA